VTALTYNQDNIFLLQRMFKHRRPDIQLHTAMTGRDGIKAAIDGQPALILLDNRLPDTSGEQVLLQLATAPATAAIPVVILSGDSNPVTVPGPPRIPGPAKQQSPGASASRTADAAGS
jgi:CheY-like chemotaxis protein